MSGLGGVMRNGNLWMIISAVSYSHLLSHEVQSALQGVGHFDLPVAVVDLNTSRTEREKIQRIQKLQLKLGAVPFML